LPKGKEDKDYGFDFIPYMLHSIDERRKRFDRSSKVFLSLTIVLGLVFSSVLVYFGYILINEAAAGPPRILANLEDETKSIKLELQSIIPRLSENPVFQKTASISLQALRNANAGSNKEIADEVQKAINKALSDGDLLTLKAS